MRFFNYMTDLANDYISTCSQSFQTALSVGHPPLSGAAPALQLAGHCGRAGTRHCSQGCSIPVRDGFQPAGLERHHRPSGLQRLF